MVIRGGADEVALRAQEEGTFIDSSNVGDQRWVPPSVDAEWHAFCQAIFQGVESDENPARVAFVPESPTAALAKELGGLELVESAPSVTCAW